MNRVKFPYFKSIMRNVCELKVRPREFASQSVDSGPGLLEMPADRVSKVPKEHWLNILQLSVP